MSRLSSALRAAVDGVQLVVIGGPSGIGKSAVAAALAHRARLQGGQACRGKFDQFLPGAPFSAPLQALAELCGALMTQSEERLQHLRRSVVAAVGSNLGLLVGLMPMLGMLLEADGATAEHGVVDAQQTDRLKLALAALVKSLASHCEPLVLLLDDIQWSDPATLSLLSTLLLDASVHHLCIVVTFRTSGPRPGEPFAQWLADVDPGASRHHLLDLGPLSQDGMAALVTSRLDGSEVDPSTLEETQRRVQLAAGGNPLHAIEAVLALQDMAARSAFPTQVPPTEVHARFGSTATDIQSLIRHRLQRLPGTERRLLTIVACAGRGVDVPLLGRITARPVKAVAMAVGRLIDAGMLEIVSTGNLLDIQDGRLELRIAHDQIQAAVRAEADDHGWKRTHLSLSRALAESGSRDLQAGLHLAQAVDLLDGPARRLAGLRLLVLAAEDAGRAAAFEIALQFLVLARSLRADDAWERRHAETFALEAAWHRTLSCLGRYDECEAVYKVLIFRARDPAELIGATVLHIVILQGRSMLDEAVALGIDLLRRVSPTLAFDALGSDLSSEWQRFRIAIEEWPLEALADAPPAEALVGEIAGLLSRTGDAAYGNPSLVTAWCGLSLLSLWKHAGFHESMVPATMYLGVHAATLGMPDIQQRLASFGMEVARRRAGSGLIGSMELGYSLTIAPWNQPLEDTLALATSAFDRLQRAGNIEMASYAAVAAGCIVTDITPTLLEVEQSVTQGLHFAQRLSQVPALACLASILAFTGRLRSRDVATATDMTGYPYVDFHASVYRALAALVMNEEDELARHVETVADLLSQHTVIYAGTLGAFAIAWMEIGRIGADALRDPVDTARLDANMAFIAQSAERMPTNYRVLDQLLQARRAAAEQRPLQAMTLFDAAAQAAAAVSRPWQHALAIEHGGRFALKGGLVAFGQRLLREAHQRYLGWGATQKAERLLQEFVFLGTGADDPRHPTRPSTRPQDMDRVALFRASQALSSETDMPRLVERILAIVTQLTGATGASLLWRSDASSWRTIGQTRAGEKLPQSLVRYASRSLRFEAIHDLATDPRFAADPDIGGGPRSVLVTPITDKGIAVSILLLENSHAAGYFTSAHMDTVQLIAGQLSISLQNAELYQTLEMRVARRTEELHRAATALALRDRALESSSNGVHISELTAAGNVVVYVNAMFERITGYAAAALTGSSIAVLLGPEPDQAGARELRDAVEARRTASATLRCHRPDGSTFWNELSISPFESADGAVYFVGVHMDVSERIRAAEAEKVRTDRLGAVFELSPDGFVVLDASATITVVNPAFSRMTGLVADDLLGRRLSEFEQALEQISVPSGELVDRGAFANVLSGEPQTDVEAGMGEHGWLLTIALPKPRTLVRRLRRALSGPETVIYFRDVTRELEVDRMKSEFLSVAAHELRTPMTSIYGFSELLITGRLPQDQQAGVHRIIHKQSSALIGLVGQLLDLARINAMQGANFVLRPTSLQSVAREVMGAMRGIESSERIVDALPDGDVLAMIDADQMQLAITNVLSNALKYSSAGPVRVDLARRRSAAGRPQAGLRVADRGMGMTAEQLGRLFERFYRVHPSAGTAGTGLGATIVRDIMTAHKGEVEVASEFGVGTTVTLWVDRIAH